ncbi:hypothetical protein GCM10010954_21420 [Halobacillus andaensis]|uniref:Uncharacterized protein n=1 Tax=Halobacillus andaensis TaxID=1176239 RepID=A0A917B767_HALAA|nr:hypothetical protein [Halobacillus andaensis]MBP2004350.1 hypothetical protein [Halobacillus andaensis]GGF22299.1 hypothetical protein GCM10010954_21420 [Halobacillus andaensis]
MRKKVVSMTILVISLLAAGCDREDDNMYDADFQGTINEVKENSIIVGEDDVDPEASYPTYKILIDDKTELSGEVERFEELDEFVSQTDHHIVHIWVIDKGENNEIDNKTASEVIVEKEEP